MYIWWETKSTTGALLANFVCIRLMLTLFLYYIINCELVIIAIECFSSNSVKSLYVVTVIIAIVFSNSVN